MSEINKLEYRLEIGDITIGISAPTKEYTESFAAYFGIPSSKKNTDLKINLSFDFHTEEIEIPDSLFMNKQISGNKFVIAGNVISGHMDRSSKTIDLHVKKGLTQGSASRVFEQILYQAYYSSCFDEPNDSFLIHGSGIIHGGKGYLFTGKSGSGKSTIAELSSEHTVLNDEICLISYTSGMPYIESTPYNGYCKIKKRGKAPLCSVFLLKHGKTHMISEIKKSDAIKEFAAEIVPPIAVDEALTGNIFFRMMDIADKLNNAIRIKRLEFLPNNDFWKIIVSNI